jgi:hypothetical protein
MCDDDISVVNIFITLNICHFFILETFIQNSLFSIRQNGLSGRVPARSTRLCVQLPSTAKRKKILSSSFFKIYRKLFVNEYKKKELNA